MHATRPGSVIIVRYPCSAGPRRWLIKSGVSGRSGELVRASGQGRISDHDTPILQPGPPPPISFLDPFRLDGITGGDTAIRWVSKKLEDIRVVLIELEVRQEAPAKPAKSL